MKRYDLAYLLLATQRALLGMVIPSLRAVVVNLNPEDKILSFDFYYDGEISDKAFDLASCAITEASAAFSPEFKTEEKIVRIDAPSPIPCVGKFAYKRKE